MKAFACVFLLSTLVAQGVSQSNTAIRSTLQAKYAALTRAFVAKNIAPFERTLAPNYVGEDKQTGTKMTKAVVLRDFTKQMSNFKDAKWPRTIRSLKVTGNTAVAMVSGRFSGTMVNGGQSHKFLLMATSQDTWKKSGSDWVLLHTLILTRTVTMDGHPIDSVRRSAGKGKAD